jgi:hypothetical protein
MYINTANFGDFVNNLKVKWRQGYERVPKVAQQLFDVSASDELVSDHSSMSGGTFARRVTEGDNHFVENPTQNYRKTMTKYRVSLARQITWEMRKYDKYREIRRSIETLGEEVAQRLELDLTHRFTFGTATTYTDMDGVSVNISTGDALALFHASHTVPGSSTTFRNRVANSPAFGRSGLEAAESLFAQQMIDPAGNKIVVIPDTIVTTDDPATVNAVKEFLNSTASLSTSNAGNVNVYKQKYNHLVLPYLATTATGARDTAKEKYWLLLSVAHTDGVLEISEMPNMTAPSPGGNGENFWNDAWAFKASAAYGIEIVDPKWAVLSIGDAVTA